MTTHTSIQDVRKSVLDAINTPQTDTALLRQMLKDLKAAHPDLFVPYKADENYEPIASDVLQWNEQYFSQQKRIAGRNFSPERLEHLIQVRERFRKEGRKGFVLRAEAAPVRPRAQADGGYTPSANLRKFVEEGDLLTVRTALTVELEDSRQDARSVRAALAWTKVRIPDLCEPYTEKAFARAIVHDCQQWTVDYYSKQTVFLDTNFAEERFLHLLDVREHLRQRPARQSEKVANPAPGAPPRPAPQPRPAPHAGAGAQSAQQAQRGAPPSAQRGLSPAMLAALLIGGALAAVVILVLVMRKLA
jgi:hypothetical protein